MSNDIQIVACVLSLASNSEPTRYLALAKQALSQLGEMCLSQIIINEDKINEDKINEDKINEDKISTTLYADTQKNNISLKYHNQVAYLTLNHPISYLALVALTKKIEQQAHRKQFQKPIVTLDIDIIAFLEKRNDRSYDVDETNTAFIHFHQLPTWLGVARRFPLASYDQEGIINLAKSPTLHFLGKLITT